MTATTQQEAAELGLITYMDGIECKRGHNGRKYTVNRACVECTAERGARRNRKVRRIRTRQAGKMSIDDWTLVRELEDATREVWE